jgi:hypothetical protein
MSENEPLSYKPERIQQDLRHPDWYLRLEEYLSKTIFPVVHDDPEIKIERHKFYELVEQMLERGEIPLAESGPDLDSEREVIDTAVIHHTEEEGDIRLSKLSAIGLVRQYAKAYIEDDVWGRKGLRGKPIWSNHFRGGKMVFFAYHWLIRPGGEAERLLLDAQIGRQTQNMNPRSIGLAFSGNYEHGTPPIKQIETAAKVINGFYGNIPKDRILGHREVMPERTCPGDQFLNGWKNTLISSIRNLR